MIAHIVLFNPKPDVASSELRAFVKTLEAACRQIPSIERSRIGRRVTIEAGYIRVFGEKTYEYIAIFEFKDAAALKSYLTDPLHDELGGLFWKICESTVVLEVELVEGKSDRLGEFLLNDQ